MTTAFQTLVSVIGPALRRLHFSEVRRPAGRHLMKQPSVI